MEETRKPLFTIVTVTYNAEGVIAPTLKSVLAQTCKDYEYLVVDGASSDGTIAMVHKSNIAAMRIVSEPDKGLYDAMNKAIDMANGKYLVFLNAGDSFNGDNALQRMAEAAAGSPDVIYGQTQLVNADGCVLGPRHLTAPHHITAKSFADGMLVCHQAFVAKRSIMGHYDMKYRFSADFDWCIRCLKASKENCYLGDVPVISYLADGLSQTHRSQSLRERYEIMCKYYGTMPTALRHLRFAFRFLINKLRMQRKLQHG